MQRHAIMFRVRPGTEETVRQLLSSYEPPNPIIDDETMLVSTSVFMKDDVVIRVIEIEGSMQKVMAHLSQDPKIKKVERELEGYVTEEYQRDMSTPEGVREYFAKVLMDTVLVRVAPDSMTRPQEVST